MADSAAPKAGEYYLSFDGMDDYVEIPSMRCYSVDHTGQFSVAAWVRADVDDFPNPEPDRDYVHWLGKGEGSGAGGTQEWVCRMYNLHTPDEDPPRPKRTSFYVFNPQGGLGVGSFVQPEPPIEVGVWQFVVVVVDRTRTHFYHNGQFVDCDTYRGPASGGCSIMTSHGRQVVINPIHGPAPLRIGVRELHKGYFLGGIAKVRIWNRSLTTPEIRALYLRDSLDDVPRDWLAAEFLLNEGHGTIANDTAYMNHGTIHGASWAVQP